MSKINISIWDRRLPAFLGFFVFAFSLFTIGWLSTNTVLFGTKAATDATPKNVQISNISDTSFTVSYLTDDASVGSLQYGKTNEIKQVVLDDEEKTVHSLTVTGLTPATEYQFSILSDSQIYLNNGRDYSVKTAPSLQKPQTTALLRGKIILDNGSPPPAARVSLSTSNSQLLSTITKTDGTYEINLGAVRNTTLTSFLTFSDNSVFQMEVMDQEARSTVSLRYDQIEQVPLITLSKNYDFLIGNQPLSPSPIASASGTPPAFPTSETPATNTPQILTPQEEQSFKDQQPLFKGKAVPNETVTITINSEHTISATVTADENGDWEFRPDEQLEPGEHTITIRTLDASGIFRTITQSFVVYAEGGQFTEPSISPAQTTTTTPTQSNQPTTTPTTPPSATPTRQPSPTTTASTSATLTPTQTTVVSPSITNPPIPISGNTSITTLLIGVFSVIAIGALLFVFAAV
ncbi:MAG TPA: Ig-like domain-containing protein [Patescibacteria group bacterium]|nr:Ig-like domain-containing protein [Patescibacteria group bacterium]